MPPTPISLAQALAWLHATLRPLPAETVLLQGAVGRVLAETVPQARQTPTAAIDGRAVRAADTEGATEYAPLPVAGAGILAGQPLPEGADAVLPLHLLDAGPTALGPIARNHGVMHTILPALQAGSLLRPPHLAVLARHGRTRIAVIRRPSVALHSHGPKSGPEALAAMLAALIAAEAALPGADQPDLHLHAGRSGPGADDHATATFDTVFAHGIRIHPGGTAALGTIAGTPAILLPGDPLEAATTFALLAAPALRRLGGRPDPIPCPATLARKIVSTIGQCDAVRVRREHAAAIPLGPADPQEAADGLVLVPEASEGYPEGAMIAVHPLP